uniref:peptide-methionine (S)-S-oxide reductase n=1 Tax=Romanomermis culicivorax TaxID=13658 RepID=A0A915HJK3_ROMCU
MRLCGIKTNMGMDLCGDHTEACLIEYDPSAITFANLLSIFWSSHDPTVLNKAQYKSAVYYNDEKEKLLTEETLNEEQKRYKQKIVTEILPVSTFHNAEE